MDVTRLGVHDSVGEVFPPAKLVGALEGHAPEVVRVSRVDAVSACDAIVTMAYDEAFLDLQWIHSIQAGVDRFPFDVLQQHNVVLTNSTGIHGDSVGETVAGYMLMFARWLHEAAKNQPDRAWDRPAWDEAFTVHGTTVCVVGLGALGQGIAARASALGMDVTGVKRTVEPVEHVDKVYGADELHEAIADALFVAIAVPLTPETEGLFGQPEFEQMRDDAYLMNVARGGVIDDEALIEAVTTGAIGGAALDVFDEEPLPGSSPLWGLENVIITPHIAGVTRDYYRNVASLVRENLERIAAGTDFVNRVV